MGKILVFVCASETIVVVIIIQADAVAGVNPGVLIFALSVERARNYHEGEE